MGCHEKYLHQKLRDKLQRSNDYEMFVFDIVDFKSICKFEESTTGEKLGGKVSKLG